MLALLSALPIIGSIITGITTAFFNARVKIFQAQTGATAQVAIETVRVQAIEQQARVAGLSVIAGNKMLTLLVITFASPFVIFIWKVVVWDIVLGWGSTDPIKGQVADWGNAIIYSIFGSATAMGIGRLAIDRIWQK